MNNYILKDENAVFFECGFSCDNVIFVRLGNEAFFITDARYVTEAKEKITNAEVVEASNLTKTTRELLRKNKITKIFFDPKDFTYFDYLELTKKLSTIFTQKKDLSKQKRIIKTPNEISILTKAAIYGREAFNAFGEFIKSNGIGLSEKQLFIQAKTFLSYYGNYELSFEPIVAINANGAKPHARAAEDIFLKENDLLLIDAGLKYERYCSDRTVTLGINHSFSIEDRIQNFSNTKMQEVYDVVLKAQTEAINKARVGMRACEIDKIARDIISDAGYGKYFVHSTGHGVGLDIHELPVISARSDTIIENGMVFTVEPGIYLPNEFGVRIEDMVVMKNGKAEIL